MNFSIKGRIQKINDRWKVEIPILETACWDTHLLKCFKKIETQLQTDLDDESLKCFFKVDDSGVFYLITAQTPDLIELISERIQDLNSIKLEANLE